MYLLSNWGGISNWAQFDKKVRFKGNLLKKLDQFPNTILIAGCQRSGTTALTNIILQSQGIIDHSQSKDNELDAALILAGVSAYHKKGRHCFQTTYLNNCFNEYLEHDDYKLIWIIREPYSVVYSMLYNWPRGALNRLFNACGVKLLNDDERVKYYKFGSISVPRLRKACLSYNVKIEQLSILKDKLDLQKLFVISYDDLVTSPVEMLPKIYQFLDLPYQAEYCEKLHTNSLKNMSKLTKSKVEEIDALCTPFYLKAKHMLSCF